MIVVVFHVKHCARDIIGGIVGELGVSVERSRLDACAALADWLAPAAGKLGLTQFDTGVELAANLIGPGLYLLPHIGDAACSLAEIGPGSGALGLSIAMLRPDLAVDLLDRRKRVCDFLDIAARRFRIANCRSVCVDMRDVPADGPKYDLVVARAVAPAEQLFGHLSDFLSVNGRIAVLQIENQSAADQEFCHLAHEATNLPELWLDIYQKRSGRATGS